MRNIKKLTIVGMTAFTMATMVPVTSMAAESDLACKGYGVKNIVLSQSDCRLEDIQDALKQVAVNKNCIKWNNVNSNKNDCVLGGNGTESKPENKPEADKENTDQGTNDNINNEQDKKEDQDSNVENVKQVLSLVNAERKKEGLSPLTWNDQVAKAASVRATEIQTSFSHTRPNGSNFATVLRENGVTYRGAGENIAWGQKTPEQVVNAWMNSPGHRANIMNKNFTGIGVGYVQNASGTPYWVQLFTY